MKLFYNVNIKTRGWVSRKAEKCDFLLSNQVVCFSMSSFASVSGKDHDVWQSFVPSLSLCLVLLFHSLSHFLFPCGVWPVYKWGGKKAETTVRSSVLIQPIIACQDFDLEKLFLLLLTLSIPAVHVRLKPDHFNPNLLSVCCAALFLLSPKPSLFHCDVCCCVFTGAQQDPNRSGQLKMRGFEEEMKKSCTWQRTVPLIP